MKFFALVVMSLFVAFAEGFAQTQEQLIAGAKNEGKLVIYASAAAQQLQMYLAGFSKRYPFIKTEYFRTDKQKLVTRVLIGRASQTTSGRRRPHQRNRNPYSKKTRRPEPLRSDRSGVVSESIQRP